jgi:hypothetical protein
MKIVSLDRHPRQLADPHSKGANDQYATNLDVCSTPWNYRAHLQGGSVFQVTALSNWTRSHFFEEWLVVDVPLGKEVATTDSSHQWAIQRIGIQHQVNACLQQ